MADFSNTWVAIQDTCNHCSNQGDSTTEYTWGQTSAVYIRDSSALIFQSPIMHVIITQPPCIFTRVQRYQHVPPFALQTSTFIHAIASALAKEVVVFNKNTDQEFLTKTIYQSQPKG